MTKPLFNRTWRIEFKADNVIILELSNIMHPNLEIVFSSQNGSDMSLNLFSTLILYNVDDQQIKTLSNVNQFIELNVYAGYQSTSDKLIYSGSIVSQNFQVAGIAGVEYALEMACINFSPEFVLSFLSPKKKAPFSVAQGTFDNQLKALLSQFDLKNTQIIYPRTSIGLKDSKFSQHIFKTSGSLAQTLDTFTGYTKTIVRNELVDGVVFIWVYPRNINRGQRQSYIGQTAPSIFKLNLDTGLEGIPIFESNSNLFSITSRIIPELNIGAIVDVDVSNVAVSNLDSLYNEYLKTKRVQNVILYIYSVYYKLNTWTNTWNQTIKGFSNKGIRQI